MNPKAKAENALRAAVKLFIRDHEAGADNMNEWIETLRRRSYNLDKILKDIPKEATSKRVCIDCDHCCFNVINDQDDYRCNLAVNLLSGDPAPALMFRMEPSSLLGAHHVDAKYIERPCGTEGLYWELVT